MPDPQRLKLVEIFRSFLTNRKFSVNNKTYTLVLAPLFMLPSATMSYAQTSDVTSPEDKSSILIIKQRSGLSELDTPAVVSIVESDVLRRSREPVNLLKTWVMCQVFTFRTARIMPKIYNFPYVASVAYEFSSMNPTTTYIC